MSEDITLRLTVDETPLDHAELKRQQVESAIQKTATLSYAKLRSVANAASGVVNMVENALQMMGISISKTSQAVIQGIINIAGAFTAMAAAESVTPYQQIAAAVTIAQSVIMVGVAYQMESKTNQLMGNLSQSLNGITSIAGMWRWDW
jgi:predicted amino acid-binding ACT domain protein